MLARLGAQCFFIAQEVEGWDEGLPFADSARDDLLAFQHLQLDEGVGFGCADLYCNRLCHCHFNGVPEQNFLVIRNIVVSDFLYGEGAAWSVTDEKREWVVRANEPQFPS